MKTQNLSLAGWNSKQGGTSMAGCFFPVGDKKTPAMVSRPVDKKSDLGKTGGKMAREKGIRFGCQETTSNTQHLDACFASMWRRCT